MRRTLTWVAAAALMGFLVLPVTDTAPARAAASSPFTFNWTGGLTAPVPWSGQGFANTWDVQIHKRAVGDTMDPMTAQHGADCSPPPATHPISMLADGVYICRNHMMTAIGDTGYGEIALTPDHMVDFSSGTATITVNVSTLELNNSDWIDLWITPFSENLTLPIETGADGQGPPRDALRFSFNHAGILGTYAGDVARFDNFTKTNLPGTGVHDLLTYLPASAVTRSLYEIDLSQTHVRFGLPTVGTAGTWRTDTSIAPLGFTRGVVQLVHHSYNPNKHCATCGVDTWHWSNLYMSNSVGFTIIPGAERSVHAGGATTVNFGSPAPANALLRFSGIGPQGTTYQVSYNGGASWVAPSMQTQSGKSTEHFTSYWTPVPAGTQHVMFRGQNWWGGPWWVRDPAIWSDGAPQSVVPPPASTPQPTNAPAPKPTATPAAGGSGSVEPGQQSPSPSTIGRDVLGRLAAVVNPQSDPLLSVLLLCFLAGAVFALVRIIRS